MNIKTGYKQTEVGVIPEDWEVSPLGKFLKNAPVYGINAAAIPFNSSFPTYLRITDINDDGYFIDSNKTSVNHQLANSYILESGDIVFARTGASVGKSYAYNEKDGELVFAGFLIKISPDVTQLLPTYLKFYAKTDFYWNWIKMNSMRSGQPGINSKEYASLPIPIPSLPEQTAIATALSDTDALIESLEKLIAKKRLIKQGAMQELLTGKKRLAGFSEEWEVKKLGEIAEIIGGGTPSTFVSDYWNGNINWFTPTEIGTEKYVFDSVRKITKDGLINCSARILPIGTILLTTRAGIGDIGILKKEACTNQGFQSLVVKDGFYNEFLYYLISTLKNVLIQNASGSTFLEISPNKIKQIQVAIPRINEQTAIATILSDMDAEISALETKLSKTRQIKQGMMQELLTGRIRLPIEE